MQPVVIIVDMLEDNYGDRSNKEREEERIVSPVRDFLKACRRLSIPVVFACDSFLEGDFIFRGRMKPHAIRGTEGARVLDDLEKRMRARAMRMRESHLPARLTLRRKRMKTTAPKTRQ